MSAYLRARYPSDIAGMLPLALVGCRRAADNVRFVRTPRLAWVCVALLLLSWQTVLALSSPDPVTAVAKSATWTAYFIAATALVVAALHVTTQRFLDLTTSLGDVLTSRGRICYERWYETASKPFRQWSSGMALASAAVVALFALSTVVDDASPIVVTLPSYIVIAAAGFFVGLGVYWTIACIVLCALWARRGMLKLYRFSPAYTPGLEELSRLILHVLFGAVVLSAVLLFPAIYVTSLLPWQELSDQTRAVVLALQSGLLGLCGITVIAVGIVPQEALSAAIRDRRHAEMRSLQRRMTSAVDREESKELREQYQTVAGSPTSTLGSGNVVQIVVASATALAPFVVSLFVAHGS